MTCNDRNHPSPLLNSLFLTNKSSLHTDFQCSYSFSFIAYILPLSLIQLYIMISIFPLHPIMRVLFLFTCFNIYIQSTRIQYCHINFTALSLFE
ncbi:hypothetical protein NC651_014998 [Populus alba x Populus x berolinensis]|nr:hypothetical protein NC651_014998 [Populus alba x Populus x berolinensis]